MNDRFKFRVFLKAHNQMCNVHTLHTGTNKVIISTRYGNSSVQINEYNILMQCTGLKDKNGKLIYEGDILGGIYENLDIFYCKECMQFELHANGYGCMCCNGDIHWCEVVEDNNKLEVIGNIYENKSLLESEECE